MKAVVVGLGVMLSTGLAWADAPATEPKVGANETLSQHEQDPWDEHITPEQKQTAARAFQDANKDFNYGLGDQAVDKYQRAVKLWPHPSIHYNLALALLDLKRPVESEEHLKQAVAGGLKGLNNQPDKLEQANRYLKLIADQLATIEVSCDKEGARVSVDSKRVFTVVKGAANSYRHRIEIGKHTFVAEKPGFVTVVDAPFIGPGETFRIALPLLTADELTRYSQRWPGTRTPWYIVGGGILAGTVAGILQWQASKNFQDFDRRVARCNTDAVSAGCDANQFANLRDTGDSERTLGIVGYGLAGAAIATGALLFYLNRPIAYQLTIEQYRAEQLLKERNQKQQKQPRQAGAVSLAPVVGPGVGGAMLIGRF